MSSKPLPQRFLLAVLAIIALLSLSTDALAQVDAPRAPAPDRAARARLLTAARDSALAPWQRDIMLRVAGDKDPAGPEGTRANEPTTNAVDGAWQLLVSPTRHLHSAVYDSHRDRIVVFGGTTGLAAVNDVWVLSLSGTPTWTTLAVAGTPPSARFGHCAIYDPTRDRMVVFGGFTSSNALLDETWALSLAGTPTWTMLTPAGTPPSARGYHGGTYDPVGDRLIVIGGEGQSGGLNDVWALSLSGGSTWSSLTSSGTPPTPRYFQAAVADSSHNRIIVMGGFNGSAMLNDVWTLSLSGTPAWSQVAPTGTPPSGRAGHTAIYDPARNRVVVFGGADMGGYHNDSWALSLSGSPAWAPLFAAGGPPAARYSHSSIYDAARDRMISIGGSSGYGLHDTWALSFGSSNSWTQLVPSTSEPSGRAVRSAVYDPVRDRMILFGGFNSSMLHDTWAYGFGGTPQWAQLAIGSVPPSGRDDHVTIYDPVRDRLLVFGGENSTSYTNDLWELPLSGSLTWNLLFPSGSLPPTRYQHSAVYDPVRDRMLVFGGSGSPYMLNDVWALSLAGSLAWTQIVPAAGPSPVARYGHSAIYDSKHDRMIVFGGANMLGTTLNDVWALPLTSPTAWSFLPTSGVAPAARFQHSAIYDQRRDRMVMFGGWNGGGSMFNDTWALPLSGSPSWAQLSVTGTLPDPRDFHSAIYDPSRDRMVVFGGGVGGYINDVWALNFTATASAVGQASVAEDVLGPPTPNPGWGATSVRYAIARPGHVRLDVYDVYGRRVRRLVDGDRSAGAETVVWDGRADSGGSLPSGMYFFQMTSPAGRSSRRVALCR